MLDLLDVLVEADRLVDFTRFFTHSGTREVRSREALRPLLIMDLFGEATNMGIKTKVDVPIGGSRPTRAGAIVPDLHDRLIVVAPGSNGKAGSRQLPKRTVVARVGALYPCSPPLEVKRFERLSIAIVDDDESLCR